MTISFNGTSGVTFPDASTQATAATGFGFKNRIINGAMMIDQRNAGASVTPTSGSFTVDRWQFSLSQASKLTAQQSSTAPAGFTKSLLITSSSAYTVGSTEVFGLLQPIEGLNMPDVGFGAAGASTLTLSFWVRSSLTGTFGGVLTNYANDRTYPFSYTISAANTWEQKTVTITGDTSGTWLTTNSGWGQVWFGLGVGSSKSTTAGAWAAGAYYAPTGATSVVGTNGATFYITGVQLEKGSTATSFDYRPYGTELALCQRYFCSCWPPTVAVGSYGAATYYIGMSVGTNTTAQLLCGVSFPVEMRTSPTFTMYDLANPPASGKTYKGANAQSAYSTNGSTRQIYAGSQSANNANEMAFNWSASAEL